MEGCRAICAWRQGADIFENVGFWDHALSQTVARDRGPEEEYVCKQKTQFIYVIGVDLLSNRPKKKIKCGGYTGTGKKYKVGDNMALHRSPPNI